MSNKYWHQERSRETKILPSLLINIILGECGFYLKISRIRRTESQNPRGLSSQSQIVLVYPRPSLCRPAAVRPPPAPKQPGMSARFQKREQKKDWAAHTQFLVSNIAVKQLLLLSWRDDYHSSEASSMCKYKSVLSAKFLIVTSNKSQEHHTPEHSWDALT